MHHDMGSVNVMAVSAMLHCLTGCAIGETAGLIIGTAAGLSNGATIIISIVLAFFFGFLLSSLPLLKAGLSFGAALKVVVAADTVSIATLEVVDNIVRAVIPGAGSAVQKPTTTEPGRQGARRGPDAGVVPGRGGKGTDALPLSTYTAVGGLRQDPWPPAQSMADIGFSREVRGTGRWTWTWTWT